MSTSLSKRNSTYRRKLAKNLPLIQKEIETETQYKQGIERLIESIVDCNVYKVKFHLENGANANTKYNNWSLLHYACSMIDQVYSGTDQHLELIRILLEHGAEINSQDEDRWTPLHLACQLGVVRVISWVFTHSIIVWFLAKRNRFCIFCRYLVKRGADRDACTVENLRPIDLIEPDNISALTFLISKNHFQNGRS